MSAEKQQDQSQQKMPKTLGGVVAYLSIDGAITASEFYQKAFGAREMFRYPPDEKGRTMHVHLYVNGSSVMLSDFYPEHGHPKTDHQGFSMQLIVDDIDMWWKRAMDAGCESLMPVQLMFWGDRWGQLRDPFGVTWAMNAPAGK